jgi:hypothetical protein
MAPPCHQPPILPASSSPSSAGQFLDIDAIAAKVERESAAKDKAKAAKTAAPKPRTR